MTHSKTKFDTDPKVSIIIPVYNGSNYVEAAIQSALQQTYQNIEVIVVNDGSTDSGKTEEIIRSFGNRLRYISKKNGGVASALNTAIEHMTGDYFSWLSHDDLYLPYKIEKQINVIQKLEYDRCVIYSDYEIFIKDPRTGRSLKMDGVHPNCFRYWLTTKNCLHGCTLLIPKSAFQEVGIFDETLKTNQDYDLWFRMAKAYQFVHLREVLVQARSHPEQDSLKKMKIVNTECDFLMSHFVNNLSPEEITKATHKSLKLSYENMASSMWARGFVKTAKICENLAKRHTYDNDDLAKVILSFVRKMSNLLKYFRRKVVQCLPHPLKTLLKKYILG